MDKCDKCDLLKKALNDLLNRITSEPTMSGHLRNMHIMRDHGEEHKTSDAIRAATVLLLELEESK